MIIMLLVLMVLLPDILMRYGVYGNTYGVGSTTGKPPVGEKILRYYSILLLPTLKAPNVSSMLFREFIVLFIISSLIS